MSRKITVRGLAKATEEYIEAAAKLRVAENGMSVYPVIISDYSRANDKLTRLLAQVNMEAKDGSTRRVSQKKERRGVANSKANS